jgi:uncharacterized protein (DUF1778 family)
MKTVAKKSPSQRKSEQLVVRITPKQKALIQRAADVEGMTLTEFVTGNLNKAAKEAIKDHEVIRLTEEDALQLAEALQRPPREPGKHLLEAAKEYYKNVERA